MYFFRSVRRHSPSYKNVLPRVCACLLSICCVHSFVECTIPLLFIVVLYFIFNEAANQFQFHHTYCYPNDKFIVTRETQSEAQTSMTTEFRTRNNEVERLTLKLDHLSNQKSLNLKHNNVFYKNFCLNCIENMCDVKVVVTSSKDTNFMSEVRAQSQSSLRKNVTSQL